jgi:hypothetical protein
MQAMSMRDFDTEAIDQNFLLRHTQCLLRSFKRWTGKELCSSKLSPEEQAKELFYAPFVVVSSDATDDPLLTYGNLAALKLWELSWEKLLQTPARETAEPVEREEREQFLREVKKRGFIDNYRGIRISSTGRRFEIRQATVWNLIDEANRYVGQAATFKDWIYV